MGPMGFHWVHVVVSAIPGQLSPGGASNRLQGEKDVGPVHGVARLGTQGPLLQVPRGAAPAVVESSMGRAPATRPASAWPDAAWTFGTSAWRSCPTRAPSWVARILWCSISTGPTPLTA